MYNKCLIDQLVGFIESLNGIGNKTQIEYQVKDKFGLTKNRSIFYNDHLAIRFGYNGKNNNKSISNTVLGLAAIKKYDDRPLIFCIITHSTNHLLLINTTFLKKVSHSSKNLSMDKIRGSINCSDIIMEYEGLSNNPTNFESLYKYHSEIPFEQNLSRLVENTNNIVGRIPKFNVTPELESKILSSVDLAQRFVTSKEYADLQRDLEQRTKNVQNEIALAALNSNVNLRGRIIEYLITDDGSDLKKQVIDALQTNSKLPTFKTPDQLGDYVKGFALYNTQTDIKTKLMSLNSNPKAYNIDKLLEFLSTEKAVYLIYLVGIDQNGKIMSALCSCFDKRLIAATCVQHHWAGRNTRGEAQFVGNALKEILHDPTHCVIDKQIARQFLLDLIAK